MKFAAILALLLAACANDQIVPPPQTVTITHDVPVYPPDRLFSTTSGCNHPPQPEGQTVRDALDALIDERRAVDVCLGDRGALRQWKLDAQKGSK
jgi:hypothetical protein